MAKVKLSQEQRITLAQLQVMEGTYSGLRTSFETAKSDAKTSKTRYDQLSARVEELMAEIDEEDNDTRRQALRVELAEKKKELEELDIETSVKKATKDQLKKHIDQSIEDMKDLPGVREAIQELVSKRYDTEIKKLGKEKEKAEKDKENIDKISELTDEEKTEKALEISDSFKDMLDARNEMKKAKARITEIDIQLKTETDTARRADLQQEKIDMDANYTSAQTRYQAARIQFITLSKGEDVEFEEAEVDHIVAVVNDGMKRRPNRENDYNLEKVLSKQSKRTEKQVEMLGEQIREYEQGREAIQQEQQRQGQPAQGGQGSEEQEKLHFWNPLHWKKMWTRHKQKLLEAEFEQEQEQQGGQSGEQQVDNDKAHKAFVRELQRNATIDSIVNREMRETRDRAADVQRKYEENDRD